MQPHCFQHLLISLNGLKKMLMKKSLNAFLKADTLIIVVNAAIKITIKIQATRLLAVLIIW